MRKTARLGIALVVALTVTCALASNAAAISRNKYEWCYENGACFGIVTINKSAKTWGYNIGGERQFGGSFTKSAGLWRFHFTNASSEACEMRMTKVHRNLRGSEICEGVTVEATKWKRR